MYILLVIIHLLSGQVEVHHSIVRGPQASTMCHEATVPTMRLYSTGKFEDGPDPDQIKRIEARCIKE